MLQPARFVFDHHADPVTQTAAYLREQIAGFAFAPGQRLTRTGLARQLQIPPAVVGGALALLTNEGLLQRGATALTVQPIDATHARQAHFLRLAVELEIAKRLSASPAANLKLLHALVDMQRACLDGGDLDGLVRSEQLFNKNLYEAAKVGALWDDTATRRTHLDRIVPLQLGLRAKAELLIQAQRQLLDAFAAGDRALAMAAVRARLDLLMADIGLLRARHPHWIAADDVPAARDNVMTSPAEADLRWPAVA